MANEEGEEIITASSSFSHEELVKITSSVLNDLLKKDSYLNDLPANVTLDEISNQIALLHGQSITVGVIRGDEIISVVIPETGSRVSDLKRAIRRTIDLKLKRDEGVQRKISWKKVWRAYSLKCKEVVLENDYKLLKDCGIRHNSTIDFVRKRRKKGVI